MTCAYELVHCRSQALLPSILDNKPDMNLHCDFFIQVAPAGTKISRYTLDPPSKANCYLQR